MKFLWKRLIFTKADIVIGCLNADKLKFPFNDSPQSNKASE